MIFQKLHKTESESSQDVLERQGIHISYSPTGKPLVSNSHISISHKHDDLYLALSQAPLGIDIEDLSKTISTSAFLSHLSGELTTIQYLENAHHLTQKEAIIALFSIKEAFCKLYDVPLNFSRIVTTLKENVLYVEHTHIPHSQSTVHLCFFDQKILSLVTSSQNDIFK